MCAALDDRGRGNQRNLCLLLQLGDGQRATVAHGRANLVERQGDVILQRASIRYIGVNAFLEGQLLCAAQAADFKGAEKLGKGTRAAYDLVRSEVTFMEKDRAIYLDMNKVAQQIREGKYVQTVESVVGPLK